MEALPSNNLGSPDSVAALHFDAGAAKKLETLVLPNAAALPPPPAQRVDDSEDEDEDAAPPPPPTAEAIAATRALFRPDAAELRAAVDAALAAEDLNALGALAVREGGADAIKKDAPRGRAR